jgi:hypothetical protein
MQNKWIFAGVVGISVSLGGVAAAAQSYNPMHWMKKSPTASEQLAANKDESKKLGAELQAILPPRTSLADACMAFKSLEECVATLHASRNLKVKFNCLKWNVTAVQPTGNLASCTAPQSGKAISLSKAIHVLKPDADAKAEAKNAERRAQEDIKDASS